ncbi:MAG: response regulator transcription factor [Pseudomonadota bacterium]
MSFWVRIFAAGAALAAGAFVLQWLEYQRLLRELTTETYIFLIALGFTVLGVWVGRRLTARPPGPATRPKPLPDTDLITPREQEVLVLLAQGLTNKQIARELDLSPNTIKTHVARLFEKLEVERRTQAAQRARELALIP